MGVSWHPWRCWWQTCRAPLCHRISCMSMLWLHIQGPFVSPAIISLRSPSPGLCIVANQGYCQSPAARWESLTTAGGDSAQRITVCCSPRIRGVYRQYCDWPGTDLTGDEAQALHWAPGVRYRCLEAYCCQTKKKKKKKRSCLVKFLRDNFHILTWSYHIILW